MGDTTSMGKGLRPRPIPLLSLLLVLLLLLVSHVSAQAEEPDYTCSETRPCALGCCGLHGICGMGPEFCGPGKCVNSCNAKSECDPAGWGPQYAARSTCPLNVCCSKFGFCGTTADFCDGRPLAANPSCPGGAKSATQRTIGYYEGWGVGRACDAMLPETIPLLSYTHINFAFAGIDPVTFSVVAMSPGDLDLMRRLTALKRLYPGLQVWIAIGGWSMNDPGPTFHTFSDLANSAANQQKFFASLISFMSFYGFDGVDIDWEYPVAEERGGRPSDFQAFPVFMRNLRSAFRNAGKSWGVTLTLPSSFWYMQHFDIVKLEPVVDWFNMMEYDIHGTWDAMSVWTGAKVGAHTNLTEIDLSLKLMWRNNINPAKVVLGLGFYGRSYELASPSCADPGCPFVGGAPGGPCTNSAGTLSYGEIRRIVQAGATPRLDVKDAVQILSYGDRGQYWVSYDDATTLKLKVDYANRNCLGGTMVWAVSTDDERGSAATALRTATYGGGLNMVSRPLALNNLASISTGRCTWTGCGTPCPSGYRATVQVPDGCPQGSSDIGAPNRRTFCCPSNNVPRCQANVVWGHDPTKDEPMICNPQECPRGMTLLTTTQTFSWLRYSCHTGHINVCCENVPVLGVADDCAWTECGQSCPAGTTLLTRSLTGPGGYKPCTSGQRALCCPPGGGYDASRCSWRMNAFHGTCTPMCPPDKVMVAVDAAGAGCRRGNGAFCCDPPETQGLVPRSYSPNVDQWERTVRQFMANPECEDGTVGAPGPTSAAAIAETLLNRLTLWIQYPSDRFISQPFKDAWDRARAANGNIFPSWDQLIRILDLPRSQYGEDYARRLENVLCAGDAGVDNAEQTALTVERLCRHALSGRSVSPEEAREWARHLAKLAEEEEAEYFFPGDGDGSNSTETLDKRGFVVNWIPNSTPQNLQVIRPTTADVLQEVVNGGLRFEYYRWFPYTAGGTLNPPTVELEVAFLLGPNPNNIQTRFQGRNLQAANPAQVRDTRHRFIVFHIHFDRDVSAPTTVGNNANVPQLRITAINARHGNRIQFNGDPWMGTVPGERPGRFEVEQERPRPGQRSPPSARVLDCPLSTGVNPSQPGVIPAPNPGQPPLHPNQLNLITHLLTQIRGIGNRADMRHNLFTLDPPNMDDSTIWRYSSGHPVTPWDPNWRIIGNTPNNPGAGSNNAGNHPGAFVGPGSAPRMAFDINGNPYVPPQDVRNDPNCYNGPQF